MESMTPADILAIQGQGVTVTGPDGKQARAIVTSSQVSLDRIDVTTERHWIETGEREYIDGRTTAILTLAVFL
jgi:hypothetical protein